MCKLFLKSALLGAVLTTVSSAQTQLSIQTSDSAWVDVDQQRRGLATAAGPLRLPVTPGKHTVSAEGLLGGKQEVEVDAAVNATTYVSIKLGSSGVVPFATPPSAHPLAAQDPAQQQQKELERQQRDSQIHQLEQEITNLEQQMAQAQSMKDQADQATQDCQTQSTPGWIGALKGANCMLGKINSNNAQQQIRQLQVQINAKQREVQRLDRLNSSY